jgi:cell wall-associated NlpC family hydrolase
LPAAACEVCQEPAAKLDAIITAARQLLGTPYLWGGRTSAGVDCSGLVQISYRAAGLHLPRDSYQQFYVGQLTATRWHTAGLRRGDTLYFLGDDGKIRHTGLYLGDDQFVQAVSPVVRINSFNPEDANYDARRHASFAFAKRLLD